MGVVYSEQDIYNKCVHSLVLVRKAALWLQESGKTLPSMLLIIIICLIACWSSVKGDWLLTGCLFVTEHAPDRSGILLILRIIYMSLYCNSVFWITFPLHKSYCHCKHGSNDIAKAITFTWTFERSWDDNEQWWGGVIVACAAAAANNIFIIS